MARIAIALMFTAGACAEGDVGSRVQLTTTTLPTTTTSVPPSTSTTVAPTSVVTRRRAAPPPPSVPASAVSAPAGEGHPPEGNQGAQIQLATISPVGDVEAAIHLAWGNEGTRAVRVARCESGLRPAARNGPHAGLFQVNVRIHAARIARMGFTTAQMYEAGPNIAVAHALWAEQGWRPWTCAA